MAGWTALARYQEGGEGEQPLYEENEDDNKEQQQQLVEEGMEAAVAGEQRPKRVTTLQLQKLFPTLFTPRVYYPPPKPNQRVQAKPVFAYDPYYLVRI